MELLVSFIISVIASVVGYYICKWLDGYELKQSALKKNAPGELPGVFCVLKLDISLSLAKFNITRVPGFVKFFCPTK